MDLSFNLDLLYMIKLFRPDIYTVLAFERAVTFLHLLENISNTVILASHKIPSYVRYFEIIEQT